MKHLGQALQRVGRNIGLLAGVCLVFWLPTEVVANQVWGLVPHERIAMVLSSIVYALGTAATSAGFMHIFAREAAGRPATFSDALQIGARRTPAVFATSLLVSVFVTLGLVLLVVPAVVVMVFCSLTTVVVVVEGSSGWKAIRRSRELVRGRAWPLFGVLLLLWVVPMSLELLLGFAETWFGLPLLAVDLTTGWLVVLIQTPVHAALFGFYLEGRLGDR